MTTVTLYGRPDCHLCDEARDEIEALRGEGLDFDLREIDIEGDPRLHTLYLERIPVIEVGGEIVSELDPDISALRSRLGSLGP